MLSLRYLYGTSFAEVKKLADFYKESLPEIPKIKQLMDNIKLQFKLPQSNIILQVAEGERIYKIILLDLDVHKRPFGFFVYIPGERRLDAFKIENPGYPILQWKNKKLVFSDCSPFLINAGISTIFTKLVNIL